MKAGVSRTPRTAQRLQTRHVADACGRTKDGNSRAHLSVILHRNELYSHEHILASSVLQLYVLLRLVSLFPLIIEFLYK